MKYKYILCIGLVGLLFSCKPELDDFSPSEGNADFSVYVALGNSLTAGYADGSLYRSSQMNSYPAILAEQFQKAGGGEFTQPLISTEEGVGFTINPTGLVFRTKAILGSSTNCLGETSLGPIPAIVNPNQTELYNVLFYPVNGLYNNLGVPGAKSFHLTYDGYGNPANLVTNIPTANTYFVRFASATNTTILGDALAQNPTFFTLWIGNNDILGYAASGGWGDTITGLQSYTNVMNMLLTNLTSGGAKGVIANIPDMLSAPYFSYMSTKVPYNGLVLTNQAQVDALNAAYLPLGITFALGQNPFIVRDALSPYPRQMKPTDRFLLTLPTDSLQCFQYGSAIPIPHKYILDENEISNVNNAIEDYNQVISDLAIQYNLAFIDVYTIVKDLKSGIVTDGITLTADFVTGNAFSLDGIHLTQMGYAYIANQFIKEINAKYGSNLPTVSLTNYQSVILP
jgi:lysophospholipase L1-like esterase